MWYYHSFFTYVYVWLLTSPAAGVNQLNGKPQTADVSEKKTINKKKCKGKNVVRDLQ